MLGAIMAGETIVQGGGTLTQAYGCTAWGLANRSEWNCPNRNCGPFGFHAGIDIAAAPGARPGLLAVGYGRVMQIGRLGGYCGGLGPNAIGIISGPWAIWYGHASAALVRAGDLVIPGQLIGRMGSLGCSTGNHVHFEVLPIGSSSGCDSVNPWPFLSSWPGQPPAPAPGPSPAPISPSSSPWLPLALAGGLIALAALKD